MLQVVHKLVSEIRDHVTGPLMRRLDDLEKLIREKFKAMAIETKEDFDQFLVDLDAVTTKLGAAQQADTQRLADLVTQLQAAQSQGNPVTAEQVIAARGIVTRLQNTAQLLTDMGSNTVAPLPVDVSGSSNASAIDSQNATNAQAALNAQTTASKGGTTQTTDGSVIDARSPTAKAPTANVTSDPTFTSSTGTRDGSVDVAPNGGAANPDAQAKPGDSSNK